MANNVKSVHKSINSNFGFGTKLLNNAKYVLYCAGIASTFFFASCRSQADRVVTSNDGGLNDSSGIDLSGFDTPAGASKDSGSSTSNQSTAGQSATKSYSDIPQSYGNSAKASDNFRGQSDNQVELDQRLEKLLPIYIASYQNDNNPRANLKLLADIVEDIHGTDAGVVAKKLKSNFSILQGNNNLLYKAIAKKLLILRLEQKGDSTIASEKMLEDLVSELSADQLVFYGLILAILNAYHLD